MTKFVYAWSATLSGAMNIEAQDEAQAEATAMNAIADGVSLTARLQAAGVKMDIKVKKQGGIVVPKNGPVNLGDLRS